MNETTLVKDVKIINDNFQNFKRYNIPKAQLVIADIPYNLGMNAYASNPSWYVGGDNRNGESALAGKQFFNSDLNFNIAEFFHREKLPKFNNDGRMIFNCMDWERDTTTPKIHPTQKPIRLLENLIRIFTDENDIIIDPVCGSGSSLVASANINRKAYGFEIDRNFYRLACENFNKMQDRKLF